MNTNYRAKETRHAGAQSMEVIKIISQHKRARGRMGEHGFYHPPVAIKPGHKRVEAIVRIKGMGLFTRHIDIQK
jgi:hypothetical protein